MKKITLITLLSLALLGCGQKDTGNVKQEDIDKATDFLEEDSNEAEAEVIVRALTDKKFTYNGYEIIPYKIEVEDNKEKHLEIALATSDTIYGYVDNWLVRGEEVEKEPYYLGFSVEKTDEDVEDAYTAICYRLNKKLEVVSTSTISDDISFKDIKTFTESWLEKDVYAEYNDQIVIYSSFGSETDKLDAPEGEIFGPKYSTACDGKYDRAALIILTIDD